MSSLSLSQVIDYSTISAKAMAYASEVVMDSKGKVSLKSTKEGMEDFIRLNKQHIGGSSTESYLGQVQKTLSRRFNEGRRGPVTLNPGQAAATMVGFFQTHMDDDGNPFDLSDKDGTLGKTAAPVRDSRYVRNGLDKLQQAFKTGSVANPQEFGFKGAAAVNYIFGHVMKNDPTNGWLGLTDVKRVVSAGVAKGDISKEFGAAVEAVFLFGAQTVYRGRAQQYGFQDVICKDMGGQFQRAVSRLAGDNSNAGSALNAVSITEATGLLNKSGALRA